MLEFKPVTKQEAPRLRRYYQTCEFGLCEYSVGTKLMWKAALHPAWAEIAGCLVVRNEIDGQVVFDYPVPGPEGDEDAALEAIENDCLERGIPPVISVVPECRAAKLLGRYPYVRVSDVRTWRDYVYYREDLQFFAVLRPAEPHQQVPVQVAGCAVPPPDGGGRTGDRAVLAGL